MPKLRPDTFALTVLLAALIAIGPLSTDMYLPSMPQIGQVLGASNSEVQLTLSLYLVGFACGQILYGPVSDRHGRKPVLLAALGIYTAATALCFLAPSIGILIGARIVQALGGAGAIVLARAVVRDLYSGARAGRELSRMSAVMALAPVVAPVIGGILQTSFGWRSSFYALFAIGLLAMLVVWRLLPETLAAPQKEPVSLSAMMRNYGAILRNRDYRIYLAIAAFSYGGLFAWISASSFALQSIYRLTAFEFGVAFAVSAVGFMLGASLATRFVGRLGLGRTIGFGAAALAAGGLAMLAAVLSDFQPAAGLVLPAALYLAGLGLALPQSVAGALSPFPDRAGAASSLLGFVQQVLAAVIGLSVVASLGETALPLALAMALMGLLTVAVRYLR
jgi:DHA1 family bicyclomycin/chloramphenicol resistance-like MFS transporter